jgi:hypothetical protein
MTPSELFDAWKEYINEAKGADHDPIKAQSDSIDVAEIYNWAQGQFRIMDAFVTVLQSGECPVLNADDVWSYKIDEAARLGKILHDILDAIPAPIQAMIIQAIKDFISDLLAKIGKKK